MSLTALLLSSRKMTMRSRAKVQPSRPSLESECPDLWQQVYVSQNVHVCVCERACMCKKEWQRLRFTFQWGRTLPQRPGAAWHSGGLGQSCLRRSRRPLWLWEASPEACAGVCQSSFPQHCCRFCLSGRCRGLPGQPALWKHPFRSPHNSLSRNNQQMFKTTWQCSTNKLEKDSLVARNGEDRLAK